MEIDCAYQPWGYGWVFPKAERISVGMALTPSQGKDIRRSLAAYRQRRGLADNALLHGERHTIPFRAPVDALHAEGVLLVGDAAGMTGEFSAEGFCMPSAQHDWPRRSVGHGSMAWRTWRATRRRATGN